MQTARGDELFDLYEGKVIIDSHEFTVPVHVGDELPDILIGSQWIEIVELIVNKRKGILTLEILESALAFLSISFNKNLFSGSQDLVFLVVASLGIALCFLWYINIRTYQRLNSNKFKVIHEMEKHLPFACYNLESEFLKKNKKNKEYLKLTNVEGCIPLALSIPYLCLLMYSMIALLK